jgi:hypothetical protein
VFYERLGKSNRQLTNVCFRRRIHSYFVISGSDRITEAKRVTINFVSKLHTNSIFLISTECAAMATPNETLDRITRLQQARDFLKEYPKELIITASRIFKVTRSTLSRLIHKKPPGRRGGQNRVLTPN